jgi:hypothetical protein
MSHGEHWWMLLCGESRQVTLPDIEAHRFDRDLAEAERQIAQEADRLDDFARQPNRPERRPE